MGIMQKYRDYQDRRRATQAEKAAKTVTNAKAIKEDRMASIQFLADLEDVATAVTGLLPRFEYSLEHGINDTREKELAMKGIVKHGKDVLPHITAWIKKSNRIAWPIKILKEVGDEAEIVESLKSGLNFNEVSFDQNAVDKNYDILCYLRDYDLGAFGAKLGHFLNDPDERVRFSCVEVLIEQKLPEIPILLERFLADDSSENTRVRQSVISAFISHGWKLNEPQKFESGFVAPGIKLNADGSLRTT